MNIQDIRLRVASGCSTQEDALFLLAELDRLTQWKPTQVPKVSSVKSQKMTATDKRSLCAALNEYSMPGPFTPCKHAGVSSVGGSHAVKRLHDGSIVYNIYREGCEGTYWLGSFKGVNWAAKTARAVWDKFQELFPPNCGWKVGDFADGFDGIFQVSIIEDHTGGGGFPEPSMVDLISNDGKRYAATFCSKVEVQV